MIASQHGHKRALPKDDYQWFIDDESWVNASDGLLCMRTLNRLKFLFFGDSDFMPWVEFLKEENRLSGFLRRGQIPEEYINYEFYRFQWDDVFSEEWGIDSLYWPDPTHFELVTREMVRELTSKWYLADKQSGHEWEPMDYLWKNYSDLEEYVEQHEQNKFRLRPYSFPEDYQLFVTDDEWVSGSGGLIQAHYLDILRKSVGESSWIGFLNRPDRLSHILRTEGDEPDKQSILEGGQYQWKDLSSPVWGLGTNVWPDPTEDELEQVRGLMARQQY